MPETDHRIYLLAGSALFAIGFYSLLVQAHLLRRIMALNVMGSGVFLVYLALALADRVEAATGRVELGDDEDAADPADTNTAPIEHHKETPSA